MKNFYHHVFKILLTVTFLWIFCGAFNARAANFVISTTNPSCRVGNNISLEILLNSPEVAANAVQGTIKFSPNKLSLIDLNTKNSLVQFWVQEPIKNNTSGIISFEGVILNPGYLGRSGRILGLNFNCRQEGTAAITFSSGSILANDGKGTSILDNLASLNITVLPKAVVTDETGIISGTKASPKLILESLSKQATDPIVAFLFKLQGAEDPDYYEVTIDNGSKEVWPTSKSNRYETRVLPPGNHSIGVTANYKNNYSLSATKDFTIEPLVLPIINGLPLSISAEDNLEIEIITEYPSSNVKIEGQSLKGGEPIVTILTTDKNGSLKTNLKGLLTEGSYLIKAKVFLDNLASSYYTTPAVLQVEPSPLKQIQALAANYLRIIVMLAATAIVLFTLIFYILERNRRYHLMYDKKIDSSFMKMDEEGKKIIEMSDGLEGFSKEETKTLNQFRVLATRIKHLLYFRKR